MDKIPLYDDGWLITVQENFEFIAKKNKHIPQTTEGY